MKEGLELFKSGRYFEAHEAWEKIWLKSEGLERIFYQGLIQAAACLLKLEKGEFKAAKKLSESALEKLSQIPDVFLELNVRAFENHLKELSRL